MLCNNIIGISFHTTALLKDLSKGHIPELKRNMDEHCLVALPSSHPLIIKKVFEKSCGIS